MKLAALLAATAALGASESTYIGRAKKPVAASPLTKRQQRFRAAAKLARKARKQSRPTY